MRRLIAVFLTISLFSCEKDSNTFTFEGTAAGFDDGTPVYVYKVERNQPEVIDTLTITAGKFMGNYPKSDEIALHYFKVGENKVNHIFFLENEDLKATVYKDSLASSYVSGSPQNESYKAFSEKIRSFGKRKQDIVQRFQQARKEQDNLLANDIQRENVMLVQEEANYKKQFALDNNNSIFSVMLMSEMLSRKEITAADANDFVSSLSPKIAASQITTNLKTTIANAKKADVGSKAPDFSAPTPSGEMLALNDVLGKYTIIDFWASWCRPCRIENPNVVKVYNQYHDKGLNIISVSLDKENQRERWLKAIKDDKMDWYHVSNLKFWNDPIAKMYNVRSIPATFLLDEEGNIIDKNLRGNALQAKIASLLGQ